MFNVVALRGRLARPAAERLLPSGDRVVDYEVTVVRDGAPAETVPVAWLGAPASASHLDAEEVVVVVGRVRRRFFKAGGATQSRTEVVAEAVIPARHAKRAAAAVASAVAALEEAAS